ncbi:putative ssDNA binding protein [Talaromyces proteolyticus]|uniref:SsDNA binding protein n=1 Tax=Talaromyces proteolyticus TaxID=1131652 RepID=A0AAD4Q454_9EURO|nr:putative ssDNA binding protein [Talaromyces proteolyticus]KAH8702396.1 putative ssDNA binding protein [Talaromyces proteolyticus]
MQAIRSALRTRASISTTARHFSSTPANPLARLTLTGRLGAEPELSTTTTGQEIIRYSVGSTTGPSNNRTTSWFRVASFIPEGPSREHLLNVPKGSLVLVEGDVSLRSFVDNESTKHHVVSIVQRSFEVLKRNHPSGSDEASQESSEPSD